MIGRHCPVRIKSINIQSSRIYFRGQVTDAPDYILYNQADHDNRKKVGDVIQYSYQDAFHRVPDVIGNLVGKLFGLWEDREEDRYGQHQ